MTIAYFLGNYGKAALISWGAYFVISVVYTLIMAWRISKTKGEVYADRFLSVFELEALTSANRPIWLVAITRTILWPLGIYDAASLIDRAVRIAIAETNQQFEEDKGAAV